MNIKTFFGKGGLSLAAGALCLAACMGGTGEGNPELGFISVSVRAQGDAPAPKYAADPISRALAKTAAYDSLLLFDEGRTPYVIRHIYAHIDQVEIATPPGAACRASDSVTCTDSSLVVTGSRYVDLLEHPSAAILDSLPVPVGVYSRMKIRFSKVDSAQAAAVPAAFIPLVGHSIMLQGTFAYGGVTDRGLTIYLDFDDAFAFENAAGLAIKTDSPYSWAGVFLAGRWLGNLEITDCLDERRIALEPDGSLVIDSGTDCNDLEDSILENVRSSTVFEKDDD
jgi:hypothetical protein